MLTLVKVETIPQLLFAPDHICCIFLKCHNWRVASKQLQRICCRIQHFLLSFLFVFSIVKLCIVQQACRHLRCENPHSDGEDDRMRPLWKSAVEKALNWKRQIIERCINGAMTTDYCPVNHECLVLFSLLLFDLGSKLAVTLSRGGSCSERAGPPIRFHTWVQCFLSGPAEPPLHNNLCTMI